MYNSITRTLVAQAVREATLNPPNSLDLSFNEDSGSYYGVFRAYERMSPQSIVMLRRVGVFCNFADGLVSQSRNDYFNLRVQAASVTPVSIEDGISVSTVRGSRTLAGNGTLFSSSGQFLEGEYGTLLEFGSGYFNRVHSIESETELTMSMPALSTGDYDIPGGVRIASMLDYQFSVLRQIRQLNYMYEVNQILNPFDGDSESRGVVLQADLALTDEAQFLTKSISSDFSGDNVVVDIVAEFEYTPAVV